MCNKTRDMFKTWLALFRVPNLLTVPGDPLAGAVLAAQAAYPIASWPDVCLCLLASLCLYSAGLLANDYCDRDEDRAERPNRPIPSGRAQPRTVLSAALLLTFAGIGCAAWAGALPALVAIVLAIAVWAYNAGVKRHTWAGPILMGTCRGLSLLLGAVAVAPAALGTPTPWIAAGVSTGFIACVTGIARNETREVATPAWALWLPATLVLLGLMCLVLLPWFQGVTSISQVASGFTLGLCAIAVIWISVWCGLLAGRPAPEAVQKIVGGLIRGLILIQAAYCAIAGSTHEWLTLAVLLAFPIAGWLGKWFYGS